MLTGKKAIDFALADNCYGDDVGSTRPSAQQFERHCSTRERFESSENDDMIPQSTRRATDNSVIPRSIPQDAWNSDRCDVSLFTTGKYCRSLRLRLTTIVVRVV